MQKHSQKQSQSPDTICSEWDGWTDSSSWKKTQNRLLMVTGDEIQIPVTELTMHLVWVNCDKTVVRTEKKIIRAPVPDPNPVDAPVPVPNLAESIPSCPFYFWKQVLGHATQHECNKYKLADTLVFTIPVCATHIGGIELMTAEAVAAEYSQILTSGALREKADADSAFSFTIPDQLWGLPRPFVVSLLTEVNTNGKVSIRSAPKTRKKAPLYLGGKQF